MHTCLYNCMYTYVFTRAYVCKRTGLYIQLYVYSLASVCSLMCYIFPTRAVHVWDVCCNSISCCVCQEIHTCVCLDVSFYYSTVWYLCQRYACLSGLSVCIFNFHFVLRFLFLYYRGGNQDRSDTVTCRSSGGAGAGREG